MASYLQDTKIDNMNVRRCLASNVVIDNYIYREIEHWTWEKESYREVCYLEAWKQKGLNNTC